MSAMVVNLLHFKEPVDPTMFESLAALGDAMRRIDGFRGVHVVHDSPTSVVLVIHGDSPEVLNRIATEVGSPWMTEHVVPLLAGPPDRHIGPLVASVGSDPGEAAKALMARFLDAYNRGALDELDDVMGEGYVHRNNDAALTLDQFRVGAAWFRRAIPDIRIDVVDMVADGDRVAARVALRGTHTGSLFGETPSNAPIDVGFSYTVRIAAGRIVEDWEVMDMHELRRQVGATT